MADANVYSSRRLHEEIDTNLVIEFSFTEFSKEKHPLKLKVDQQADALYLTLSEASSSRSEEVAPGIIVDYDEHGRVVGVELLYLSKRAPQVDIHRLLFESVPQVGQRECPRPPTIV